MDTGCDMIVRVKKRARYVVVDAQAIEDDRLSWKARGLLVYLLSRPADWEVRIRQLMSQAPDGRDAVRSGLDELERAGYFRRVEGAAEVWEEPQGWATSGRKTRPARQGGGRKIQPVSRSENPTLLITDSLPNTSKPVSYPLEPESPEPPEAGKLTIRRRRGQFWSDRDEQNCGPQIRAMLETWGKVPDYGMISKAWHQAFSRRCGSLIFDALLPHMTGAYSWDEVIAAVAVAGMAGLSPRPESVVGVMDQWRRPKAVSASGLAGHEGMTLNAAGLDSPAPWMLDYGMVEQLLETDANKTSDFRRVNTTRGDRWVLTETPRESHARWAAFCGETAA